MHIVKKLIGNEISCLNSNFTLIKKMHVLDVYGISNKIINLLKNVNIEKM